MTFGNEAVKVLRTRPATPSMTATTVKKGVKPLPGPDHQLAPLLLTQVRLTMSRGYLEEL